MDLKLVTRHLDLSDADKQTAEEKILQLKRFLDRVHGAEVVFEQAGPQTVEVTLTINSIKSQRFSADGSSDRPMSALDVAINRMEQQLTKFKEKLKGKDRKSSGRMKAIRYQELETPPPPDEPSYSDIIDQTDPRDLERRDTGS